MADTQEYYTVTGVRIPPPPRRPPPRTARFARIPSTRYVSPSVTSEESSEEARLWNNNNSENNRRPVTKSTSLHYDSDDSYVSQGKAIQSSHSVHHSTDIKKTSTKNTSRGQTEMNRSFGAQNDFQKKESDRRRKDTSSPLPRPVSYQQDRRAHPHDDMGMGPVSHNEVDAQGRRKQVGIEELIQREAKRRETSQKMTEEWRESRGTKENSTTRMYFPGGPGGLRSESPGSASPATHYPAQSTRVERKQGEAKQVAPVPFCNTTTTATSNPVQQGWHQGSSEFRSKAFQMQNSHSQKNERRNMNQEGHSDRKVNSWEENNYKQSYISSVTADQQNTTTQRSMVDEELEKSALHQSRAVPWSGPSRDLRKALSPPRPQVNLNQSSDGGRTTGVELLPAQPELQGMHGSCLNRYQETLHRFREIQPPHIQQDLDQVLQQYKGREEELCALLTHVYGDEMAKLLCEGVSVSPHREPTPHRQGSEPLPVPFPTRSTGPLNDPYRRRALKGTR